MKTWGRGGLAALLLLTPVDLVVFPQVPIVDGTDLAAAPRPHGVHRR
jgi:hypothetical protein